MNDPRTTEDSGWRDVLELSIIEQLAMLEQASPGFFSQVMDSYIRSGRANVQALLAAASTGDEVTMRRRAHALLGSSRQVGAKDLGMLCEAIEHAEGGIPAVAALLARVEPEFERAKAALQQLAERGFESKVT